MGTVDTWFKYWCRGDADYVRVKWGRGLSTGIPATLDK